MKERFRNTVNQLSQLNDRLRQMHGQREINIKGEMQRLWGHVSQRIHSDGDFEIDSVSSNLFQGVYPVVVQSGVVIVADRIGTVHDPRMFIDRKIDVQNSPVGGFLWRFNDALRDGIRSLGIYEPDDEVILPNFPLAKLHIDRRVLDEFINGNNIFVIGKAEYQF